MPPIRPKRTGYYTCAEAPTSVLLSFHSPAHERQPLPRQAKGSNDRQLDELPCIVDCLSSVPMRQLDQVPMFTLVVEVY